MFSIGEFARHGRVSVRMLRHYDAIGLLRPATVDPASGYRFYEAGQLADLNRLVALKDLGFSLQQLTATAAPSAASRRAMARPTPRDPPVTSATRPSSPLTRSWPGAW
jgi:DNA-binding transcriptional MerR regulator